MKGESVTLRYKSPGKVMSRYIQVFAAVEKKETAGNI